MDAMVEREGISAARCPACASPVGAVDACPECGAGLDPRGPVEASVPAAVVGGVFGGFVVIGGLLFVVASFLGLAAILFGGGG